jgi:hypothetical protein
MDGEGDTYMAQAYSGEQVVLSVHPELEHLVATEDDEVLVPAHWSWVALDDVDGVALESQEGNMGKQAQANRSLASVELRSGGSGTWSFSGPLVDKLAHDQREFLGVDDAMFLLGALGVNQAYGVKKLAQAASGMETVQVRVGRPIKLAEEQVKEAYAQASNTLSQMPDIPKVSLVKEASVLGDPQSVDAVLSLGFINPENTTMFVGYLPVLEDAQYKLCDILLASRLGNLIDTPEGALEACVRGMESTLTGLKALAFQSN